MKALSPEGNEIIGTLESVQGTARAAVEFTSDGKLAVEYSGETEMDWDSQQAKTEDGERLFVCSQRKLWRESLLRAARESNVVAQAGST